MYLVPIKIFNILSEFLVIHNGIITNFKDLKIFLVGVLWYAELS